MLNNQISFFEKEDENNKSEIKELKELTEKIKYYNKKYYEEDTSEISDYEYDKLSLRLRELEKKYPEYKKDSPTMKIGGKNKEIFSKVFHEVQMQSLQDVFSYKEVGDFVTKIKEEYGSNIEFVVETKIDGLSVSLEYENGKLIRGSTRGDGNIGEDVTQNLMVVDGIPSILKSNDTIEVRGEVYLPRKEFIKINEELEKSSKKLLSNPRNAAAGTLRQLDSNLVRNRNLSIFVFNVQKGMNFKTHSESLDYIHGLGIKTLEYSKVCNTLEEIIASIKEIGNLRETLEYDIDGAVIKVNDLELRKEIGKTIKVPKWAVAYKYPPEQKETKIKDILVQVGRTGQITPLAILEPVRLAGSIISKATLHNFSYIKEMDIRLGDSCIIQKAGDVIPEVVKVVTTKRNGSEKVYEEPKVCPVCGEKLERQEDRVALKCTNSECPAQIYRAIVHFTSRDAMNIVGLGEAVVDSLIGKSLILDVADLYYLKYEDIAKLEGFKEKSINNLLKAIEDSKSNPLGNLIFGLGINHIGKRAAKILAQNFKNIDELRNASVDDILKLEEFGEIMAVSVVDFFKKKKTNSIIEKLKNASVNLNGERKDILSNKLKDKKICITGTFDSISREDLISLIEKHGGKSTSSVSKNTSFLISGQNSGSKLTKANDLNITVITLDEFYKILEI